MKPNLCVAVLAFVECLAAYSCWHLNLKVHLHAIDITSSRTTIDIHVEFYDPINNGCPNESLVDMHDLMTARTAISRFP